MLGFARPTIIYDDDKIDHQRADPIREEPLDEPRVQWERRIWRLVKTELCARRPVNPHCSADLKMTLPDQLVSTLSGAVEADDADTIRNTIVTYGLNGRDLGEWLTMASHLGHLDVMEALLEHDADVHWKSEDGETAFSFACAHDQFDAARLLHQHGADINSVDSSGGTPLDWAVCHARPEFRAWLKDVGGIRNSDHEEWPWPPNTDVCATRDTDVAHG